METSVMSVGKKVGLLDDSRMGPQSRLISENILNPNRQHRAQGLITAIQSSNLRGH